jgi:hypothetical protein
VVICTSRNLINSNIELNHFKVPAGQPSLKVAAK